ncbi:DUF4492 domain-containing protein [Desulfuromonas acetoxidans]|uniref:DUF4492 domain-containing protein n=1 Tax=Desulfuromonas acetoxidans (strain DSM 684 / 11070) TaxID=281689 RepID=Q1JXK2_DESA6|nr:DUF4492 domain-containing protein [Desulfuromonas acetoxidans]EAT14960.1 hypothetical protein Dace_0738 [Desulfuromonas acetoxidans DSM 684]MBF0644695.1 DUF4492 domain-containing protein [Desulfuromonas acetoxidans]NVD25304.1 DUF4492 domain-containing protein [Desulfuromonas acetoxidans]NVE17292.1 DUF4492 domain-containing protein [Desulfuromonas acetoxidans]
MVSVRSVVNFYVEGFRSMKLGKTLWKIILLKLLVFLTVLNLFFPDYLNTNFETDQQRADHVLNHIAALPATGR